MADSNILELADAAYKSKNYEKAHDYYTRILEEDPDNGRAWARKGIAAGGLWSVDDDRLKELKLSLKKAQEKGYDLKREDLADRILELSEDYSQNVYSEFKSQLQEVKKEAMGTGTLESVRDFRVETEGFVVGGDLVSEWFRAIKTMKYGCELAPSTERYRKAIRKVDEVLAHSADYQNYLENHDEAKQYRKPLKNLRSELVNAARELDSEFQPDKVNTGGGSCYVATATVGESSTHILDTLRDFRDLHLKPHPAGRAFVRGYYAFGPYLAGIIEKSELLRKVSMRLVVRPLYKYARRHVQD